MKVAIIYGGASPEHEVSINTAYSVLHSINYNKYTVSPIFIDREGKWHSHGIIKSPFPTVEEMVLKNESEFILNDIRQFDVVFPLLHGENGEDGTIQGFFELLNVSYIGNGIFASAVGIDKVLMKNLFNQADIPQAHYISTDYLTWSANEHDFYQRIDREIGFPCFVKPAKLGSSVGVSRCSGKEDLQEAFNMAFSFDQKVIVEEAIQGREIEIGLLGNHDIHFSVAGEILFDHEEFYDYESKYMSQETKLCVPAHIDNDIYQQIVDIARTCYEILECSGLVRADFFLTESGKVLMNEVNTLPGFTEKSMYPILWERSGVPYSELIDALINLAIEKHGKRR
ncbi:D-alanine--D-alanine ligase B [Siminovitchia terrae]|uniref:D-alanine--D-alanine ligase family protein n=1 Tax=Siminovitchia terrae TaxID=1914933 RepID=UPI001B020C6E|nr:D-alanine--D-alanine ligase family protein [Siminovitchia terrae]GIN93235.1 D-alanine--D-alanine ligase B [Siminovitchia terrae]